MSNVKKIIREIVSKKDPLGYYVVLAIRSDYTKTLIEKYKDKDLMFELAGDIIIIRCKSRRIAEKLARALIAKNLLCCSTKI